MGKPGKRKKNPGVGIDFKRAKHKVGKKLPQAQNATDTSFKAGSIVLGTQSLAVDRQGLAVSSHSLTVKVRSLRHCVQPAWHSCKSELPCRSC